MPTPYLLDAAVLRIAFILLAIACAAPAMASARPTGFLFETLRHNGVERRYAVYVPRDYDGSREWPLVVFLNGAGECGTDGVRQLAAGLAPAIMDGPSRWPFIVLFPQKPAVQDAWEDHDAMVLAMVRKVEQGYRIDRSRRYLTGLSQGGHGTWFIGAAHPDVWAAIAPICGYGEPAGIGDRLKDMPIWCFHGEADSVVPAARSLALVEAVRKAGGKPVLTTYPNVDHNSWDRAYQQENLPQWFLEHTRPAR